jgi:hypothetical protein
MTDESSHIDGSLELVCTVLSDVDSSSKNRGATRSELTQKVRVGCHSSNRTLAVARFAIAGDLIGSGAGLLPW